MTNQKNEFIQSFRNAGVKPGDILVVQSAFKSLAAMGWSTSDVIEALRDVVGREQGTLVMPAYNFESWTESHYFDSKETASKVGALTEAFRTTTGVLRTRHPIHSLGAIGKDARALAEIDCEDSFEKNSPFGFLLEHNAIYCTIGTGIAMPFLPCHYPETLMKVTYRRQKLFSGIYVDAEGKAALKTYGFCVRHKRDKEIPVYPAHKMQQQMGVVKETSVLGLALQYSDAQSYHDSMIEIIKKNPEMFS